MLSILACTQSLTTLLLLLCLHLLLLVSLLPLPHSICHVRCFYSRHHTGNMNCQQH
jgi:uncharacterized membrane protein